MVYVMSIDGKPLMPCTPPIARLLLKDGKAKCIRRTPYRADVHRNYKEIYPRTGMKKRAIHPLP